MDSISHNSETVLKGKKKQGRMCSQDVFCLGEPETSEEYLEAGEPEIFTRPYLYHWGKSL